MSSSDDKVEVTIEVVDEATAALEKLEGFYDPEDDWEEDWEEDAWSPTDEL